MPLLKDIYKNSSLHGSGSSLKDNLITNNYNYIHSYVWPTKVGNNYILISSSRLDLISALNKTRIALFVSFTLTATLAIIFGIIWLNKLISTPLKLLSDQATISNPNKLPKFPVSKGNDEISLLGKVLNDMVDAIKSRESQLLENEAQLSHTQKLAKIGGWKINHSTGKLNYSNEIFNILGLDPNITPPTLDIIANAIHPNDLTIVQEAHSKSMKEQIPYDVIHRLITKDEKVKTVHVYSQTVFDDEGLPITTIGTMQDITEQTTKDEQLRRSQKMDAIGKLTGGIAHDFNNMLGVILGFSELLQTTQNQTEKGKQYLAEIINASNRAGKLTSKLLSFSSKDNTDAINIDLNTVLNEEQIMLEKTLTVRINLILELAEDLWEINLDKNELEDALINMSINAMHAMPSGGKLTLSTQNSTLCEIDVSALDIPAGDYVLLSVTDTGTGMSQETKQKIFEPFFTTKDDKGTGLGMSQVYGFVKRSHGAIHIYSDIGHGTRITLYFPRHISNKTEITTVKENENNIDLTGTSTILVVDDEMALRELTREILSSKGYRILTAENGVQALKILETEDVNLVFSDVIMPGMDGYELSNKIRELYPNIKIQMASGFSDINDPAILESELHVNRLQKPYGSQTLLKKIKLLLK
jgi:signal transduction histidine kinase/CheY-like chemotaxis protein